MLLDHAGELVPREQIAQELWTADTFVDFEHGVNSAVNRIREALGDSASNPRFVETLARKGYRFVAPVERMDLSEDPPPQANSVQTPEPADPPAAAGQGVAGPGVLSAILAQPHELPAAPHATVRTLFVLLQLMYLGFYAGALANLPEIDGLLSPLPHSPSIYIALIVTAAMLIPARAFVVSMVLFRAPRTSEKFLTLWPWLLPLDELWALSPFLLLHHINFGVALACTALLVYSPFAQRSLMLMGAGAPSAAATT